MSTQTRFETVYRGRQSALHHLSYLRMCKVLLSLRVLRLAGIGLEGKSVFDYGFGAGTFFRYCPNSARLCGVEQDPVVCGEVSGMLSARGFGNADLQPINIGRWKEHPLLQKQYDVFLCSHVLEHLPDPVGFLRAVRPCVNPDGIFLGLVPINERAANPHHLQVVTEETAKTWAEAAGYEVDFYKENDPFLYWAQPLFTTNAGLNHLIAQALSLAVGLSATASGERLWFAMGKVFGTLTCSEPTQAAFLLRPKVEKVMSCEFK